MKKVLFIATVAATLRGFLLPFVGHFRANGWVVDGAAEGVTDCKKCLASFNNVREIAWSRNPYDLRNLSSARNKIKKHVVDNNYDLVHVHTPVASFVTRFALRNLPQSIRPALIYTAHGFHFHPGGNPVSNMIYMNFEKIAGHWTDYLVVINKVDLRVAEKHKIVPLDRLRYMPGIGVDTSVKLPPKLQTSLRSELGVSEKSKLFLMIAAFNPGKRHIDTIRALLLLNRSDAHLVFAGSGKLESRTKEAVAQLRLQDNVHFLGRRSDINDLIVQAEAVVLPSVREGLPRSLMEALCLATPCIGSDIRGIKDLLSDGCGLLFKAKDVHCLSQAMLWILENPLEAKQMGEHGCKRMKSNDINSILNQHDELYSQAMEMLGVRRSHYAKVTIS